MSKLAGQLETQREAPLGSRTALLLIDLQKGFQQIEDEGRRRNNPDAITRIVELLNRFRTSGAPIIHVRHASDEPGSPFQENAPGYAPIDETAELSGEPIVVKRVNSAFIGTGLEAYLQQENVGKLVVVGATTNHCVETTVRMAANLGFEVDLVRDATWTFERTGPDGDWHGPDDIHAMSLCNMSGEFARIVRADEIVV